MIRMTKALVASVLALALGAPGCGGSDDDEAATPQGSAGGAGGAGGSAGGGGSAGQKPVVLTVDLRADVNRDGKIDLTGTADDDGEDGWDAKHGAIFLANIDDDLAACKSVDDAGKPLSDVDLAGCNDAADEVINGDDDALDLARLKTVPWADAPDDATATFTWTAQGSVRLFVKKGGAFTLLHAEDVFKAADLRAGIELGIEAKDIVRDVAAWDGTVDVTLAVHGGTPAGAAALGDGSDTVRLRVAPVVFSHHLQPAQRVFATYDNASDSAKFRADLGKAVASVPGLDPLVELVPDEFDQWTQDFFETAYMSMPAEGGQHVVRVNVRSANVYAPNDAKNPLRPAGRVVWNQFRGKDVAAIQQYDLKHDQNSDSLNSFGNLETVPPYTLGDVSYPMGRVLRGSIPSFAPDPSFTKMLAAQRVQPGITIDTSWLLVGHVDETVSFIKTSSPRGWALVVNDPTLAKTMLEEQVAKGNGEVQMFSGQYFYDAKGKAVKAVTTISAVLADTVVMAESKKAAAEVDGQLAILKKELGLADDEIVRVPYLHQPAEGYSVAYQPGTVNGVYLSDKDFAAPKPHGPVIDGKDLFEVQLTTAFQKYGITVHFVEDWDLYHALDGEVHCGSNVTRQVRATDKWWEAAQ